MAELLESLMKLLKEAWEDAAPYFERFLRLALIKAMPAIVDYLRTHSSAVILTLVCIFGIALALSFIHAARRRNAARTLTVPVKLMANKRPAVRRRKAARTPTVPVELMANKTPVVITQDDSGIPEKFSSPDWEIRLAISRYLSITICIVALLLASFVDDWPYAFYILLRVGVCTVSLYWTIEASKRKQVFWAWALGANAVLFNPVLPIRMAREDWELVNLLAAAFLLSWLLFSVYRDKRDQRRRQHELV